jgi:histidinol phosphatase-like PHP family hydrolase
VVTDHSKSATVAGGLSVEKLAVHNDAVRRLNSKLSSIQLLTGTEMDIIAHLITRLIGKRAPVALDFDAICRAAVDAGTVLEINAST